MRKLTLSTFFFLLLTTLSLAQQLGYGIQFGLSAINLGAPSGIMAGYVVGDTVTLACIQPGVGGPINPFVSFLNSPVVKVTSVSSGAATGAIVTTPGQTNGPFANPSVSCSQASTSGSGTGFTINGQLVPALPPLPALTVVANLPTISTCGTSPPAASAGSNSNAGQFTLGTATPTACTVTFAVPYPTQAYCTVSPASSGGAAITGGYYISAQSRTAFTLTIGTGTNSLVFNYTCFGN